MHDHPAPVAGDDARREEPAAAAESVVVPFPLTAATAPTKPSRIGRAIAVIGGSAVAVALITGGVVMAAKHGVATRDLAGARADMSAGEYGAALPALQRAAKAWPWLRLAAQEAQTKARIASSAAYAAGMVAYSANDPTKAVAEFQQVLPTDVHAADARSKVAELKVKAAETTVVLAVIGDFIALGQDYSAQSAAYGPMASDINTAWGNMDALYGVSIYGAASVASAASDVSNYAAAISHLSSTMTQLEADEGALEATTIKTTDAALAVSDLRGMATDLAAVSDDAQDIERAMQDSMGVTSTLSQDAQDYGGVSRDVGDINKQDPAATSAWRNGSQQMASFIGYAEKALSLTNVPSITFTQPAGASTGGATL